MATKHKSSWSSNFLQQSIWSSDSSTTLQRRRSRPSMTHSDGIRHDTSSIQQKRVNFPTSTIMRGFLLGLLFGGIILSIIITIWLTSTSATKSSDFPSKTDTITSTTTMSTTSTSSTSVSTISTSSTTTSTKTTSTTSTSTTTSSTSSTSTSTSSTTTTSTTMSTSSSTSSSATTTTVTTSTITTASTTTSVTAAPPCAPQAKSSEVLLSITNPTSSTYPTYVCYAYTWVATGSSATLSFFFRHDPGGWMVDDIKVYHGLTQLIVNGGFETGSLSGWTYSGTCNYYTGEAYSGSSYAKTGSYYYYDRCSLNGDKIAQSFVTVPGDIYTISFWMTNYSCCGQTEIANITII